MIETRNTEECKAISERLPHEDMWKNQLLNTSEDVKVAKKLEEKLTHQNHLTYPKIERRYRGKMM